MATLFLVFWGTSVLFSIVAVLAYIPTNGGVESEGPCCCWAGGRAYCILRPRQDSTQDLCTSRDQTDYSESTIESLALDQGNLHLQLDWIKSGKKGNVPVFWIQVIHVEEKEGRQGACQAPAPPLGNYGMQTKHPQKGIRDKRSPRCKKTIIFMVGTKSVARITWRSNCTLC